MEIGWVEIAVPVGLVIAAMIGYRLARRPRQTSERLATHMWHELKQTEPCVAQLERTFSKLRRGLDDSLEKHFALMHRYGTHFCLAKFHVDPLKKEQDRVERLCADRLLQKLARVFDEMVRETDVFARGGGELTVLMPHTNFEGACMLAERLRERVEQELPITISGGVVEALDGDTPETLLGRARNALFEATTSGGNRVFRHDGEQVESALEEAVENEP